jgi:SAM-dependent methyltransferase
MSETERLPAEVESAARAWDAGQPEHFVKPFGNEWSATYWTKWGTIAHILKRLDVPRGARILDIGCGLGWTTCFLAEAGYDATGIDFAPGALRFAELRAERWRVPARFAVASMEKFDLQRRFDVVLVFDALHHSERPDHVVRAMANHLKPGGWAIFGEPSWLHYISPEARRTTREYGWVERGIPLSRLRRWCALAGLRNFERFYEGTGPYAGRFRGFAWQLIRLVSANLWVAPGVSIWMVARKP